MATTSGYPGPGSGIGGSGSKRTRARSRATPTVLNMSAGGMERFTAAGRPMPKPTPFSALSNLPSAVGFTGQAPQLLPWKFRDSDKIMVPIPIDDDEGAFDEKSSVTHDEGLQRGGNLDQFAASNGQQDDSYDYEQSASGDDTTGSNSNTRSRAQGRGAGSGSGIQSSSQAQTQAQAFEQPSLEQLQQTESGVGGAGAGAGAGGGQQAQMMQQQEALHSRRALTTSFVDKFLNVARSIVHKPMTASSTAASALESSAGYGFGLGFGSAGGMLNAVPKDSKSLALMTLLTASTTSASRSSLDKDEDENEEDATTKSGKGNIGPTGYAKASQVQPGGAGSTGIGGSDVYNTTGWRTADGTRVTGMTPASTEEISSSPPKNIRAKSAKNAEREKMKHKHGDKKFQIVQMTRGEYLKYWAKDEQGRYCGTEPEGKGKELWRQRLHPVGPGPGPGNGNKGDSGAASVSDTDPVATAQLEGSGIND